MFQRVSKYIIRKLCVIAFWESDKIILSKIWYTTLLNRQNVLEIKNGEAY